MYSKITNPETGRKVDLFGKIGQKILRNYVNLMNGGGLFGGPPPAPSCAQLEQECTSTWTEGTVEDIDKNGDWESMCCSRGTLNNTPRDHQSNFPKLRCHTYYDDVDISTGEENEIYKPITRGDRKGFCWYQDPWQRKHNKKDAAERRKKYKYDTYLPKTYHKPGDRFSSDGKCPDDGCRGVKPDGNGMWQASIKDNNGQIKVLGTYETAEQAGRRYDKEAYRLGEYFFNFPDEHKR